MEHRMVRELFTAVFSMCWVRLYHKSGNNIRPSAHTVPAIERKHSAIQRVRMLSLRSMDDTTDFPQIPTHSHQSYALTHTFACRAHRFFNIFSPFRARHIFLGGRRKLFHHQHIHGIASAKLFGCTVQFD